MTIHNRSDQKRDDACVRAFEDHYGSEWITNMSGDDAKDLLLRCWLEYRKPCIGPIFWKWQNVMEILTNAADKICKVYAENNIESYLEFDQEKF